MKQRTTYGILAILLGGIGVHRFYIGQVGKGILYLLFCWTFIPALIGFIEGIIWLTRNDDQFEAFVGGSAVNSAASIEARMAEQAGRRQGLIDQFGEEYADLILNKQITIGMPAKVLIASWGSPADSKEERNGSTVKHKYYYGVYYNSRKTRSYRHEVKLENGVVTGWKDL